MFLGRVSIRWVVRNLHVSRLNFVKGGVRRLHSDQRFLRPAMTRELQSHPFYRTSSDFQKKQCGPLYFPFNEVRVRFRLRFLEDDMLYYG